MGWLIDSSGVCWPDQMHPLAKSGAVGDPVAFAVSELGFVSLRLLNGGMAVRFNPSRLPPKAMISAFYFIADARPKRIALAYGGGSRELEIRGTVTEALRRIEELVDRRKRTRRRAGG